MLSEKVITLPMVRGLPLMKNPRTLIIFSKPKVGKTSALSELEGCLVLDLQNGGDYLKILSIKASSVDEIKAIGREIIKQGRPYKYVAIDTGTDLEEMCIPLAEKIYSETAPGQYWFKDKEGIMWDKLNAKGQPSKALKTEYGVITNMPNGSGYKFLREAFEKVYNYIQTWAPYTILACHLKDSQIDNDGRIVDPSGIDLTGKLKTITAASSDAIGYLYRKGNQNILSFKTTDAISCGARPDHLKNQDIVLTEYDPKTGELTAHWDKIYLPEDEEEEEEA